MANEMVLNVALFQKDHIKEMMLKLKELHPRWSRPVRREKAKYILRYIYNEFGVSGINVPNWAERVVAKQGWRLILHSIMLKIKHNA